MCKCDRMATLNKSLAFHRANMERQAILHTYNLDSCLCTEGLIQSEHSGKHTFPHSIRCKEWYYFCICSKYEATGRLAWLSLSSVGFRDLAFIPSMVEMLKTCPVFSVTAEAWHAWNVSKVDTKWHLFKHLHLLTLCCQCGYRHRKCWLLLQCTFSCCFG